MKDTSTQDLCNAVMASYLKQLQQEEAYRQAVRDGRIKHTPTTTWNISDRD